MMSTPWRFTVPSKLLAWETEAHPTFLFSLPSLLHCPREAGWWVTQPAQLPREPCPILPPSPDITWSIPFSQRVLLNSPQHGATPQCLCQQCQKEDEDKEKERFPRAASPLGCGLQNAQFTGEGNLLALPMGSALGRGLNAPMADKSDEGDSGVQALAQERNRRESHLWQWRSPKQTGARKCDGLAHLSYFSHFSNLI